MIRHTPEYLEFVLEKVDESFVRSLIEESDGHLWRETKNHLWFTTVCHGGDSHKLCYNRDSKMFYCYTHCGYIALWDLVSRLKNLSFHRAVDYVAVRVKADARHMLQIEGFLETARLKDLERYVELRSTVVDHKLFEFPILPDSVLTQFESDIYYRGWIDEGITVQSMKRFNIMWDDPNEAVIIPHYNHVGKLIGVRQRLLHSDVKYVPVSRQNRLYAHPLGMNLYGYHLHKNAMQGTRAAFLFEGEKSVLKHDSYYGDYSNAVAMCGFNVTSQQRDMLLHLGVEEVVLCFDKDVPLDLEHLKAAEIYCARVNTIAQMFTPYCRTYAIVDYDNLLPLKGAPVDAGKEVFETLVGKRQEITTQKQLRVGQGKGV